MKTVSGFSYRTLEKRPRTALEEFHLVIDSDERLYPLKPNATIVSEYHFAGQPVDAPIVFYSRHLDLEQAATLSARVVPRTVPQTPVFDPPVIVDARTCEVLSDDDFWSIINLLGGKAWETKINKAEVELARRSEDFVLRFAQTMAWKVHLLDHPLNFTAEADGTTVRKSDYRRFFGAVIAGGRPRFDEVLANPGTDDDKWYSDLSFFVLYLASSALRRQRKVDRVEITTTWMLAAVGENTANWEGSGFVARDSEPTPELTPEELERYRLLNEKAQVDWAEKFDIHPDFTPFTPIETRRAWFVLHYFIDMGDHALEQWAMHVSLQFGPPSVDVQVAEGLAARAGGTVMGAVSGAPRADKLASTMLQRFSVSSSLSRDEYVRQVIEGRHP